MKLKLWKFATRDSLVYGSILVASLFKIAYAWSRPIFFSGPDANGFIPGAEDFAQKSFWSAEIVSQPQYPAGYPYLLSIFVRIFGSHWIQAAQLFQILAFGVMSFFCYKFYLKLFGSVNAIAASGYLFLSTAWYVATGAAMYESLFLSSLLFSVIGIHALFIEKKMKHWSLPFIVGFFVGLTIFIHARAIPIFVVIFLIVLMRTRRFDLNIILVTLAALPLPLIFAYRNFIAVGKFTLTFPGVWAAATWNEFIAQCNSISCVIDRAQANPLGFIKQSLINSAEFWSPHSGSLERGSWFHNISLLAQLEKRGFISFAIIIGLIFSILVFASWAFGTILLLKERIVFHMELLSVAMVIWITDILVYGENRHRLIALIFMLPAHAKTFLVLFDFTKTKIGNEKNHKMN